MSKKGLKLTGLILCCLLISSLSFSQIRESGMIQGDVLDEQGEPLLGADITISGPYLIGGARTLVADNNGHYRFRSLPAGPYTVSVQIPGFAKVVRENIMLHSNMILTVDFKMRRSAIKEEVIVIGRTPTIDIKSSRAAGIVMTDNFLMSLPTGKSFMGIRDLAPGLTEGSAYGSGRLSPNTTQFDGVDVTDFESGVTHFFLDVNIIKEATVQALGLPAEYGNFTGAVLSAVSKSGSNKFSTLNEVQYNGKGWNSDNRGGVPIEEWRRPSMATATYSTNQYFDVGGQFGGKLIHDKLWFFIAGNYDKTIIELLGAPSNKELWKPKIYGKLTYQLNKSNKINVSANYYNSRSTGGGSIVNAPDIGREDFSPGFYYNINLTSILSPTTFLDTKLGYKWRKSEQIPILGIEIPSHYDYVTRITTENYANYNKRRYWTYHGSAHLSHYVPEFFKGSHDFKIGAELIHYMNLLAGGISGDVAYKTWNGAPYRKMEMGPYSMDTYGTMLTGFLQDRWSVTKRLTLNLGVRYDHYWYNFPSAERGIVYNNWNIAPRVGLSFDLLGDRKNVIKLHYAHYYEKLMYWTFSKYEHRFASGAWYDWKNEEWVLRLKFGGVPPVEIDTDPNVSQPYIRELSGGFERELFRDASLAVNFYWRTLGKAFGIFNTAAQYAPYTITNPGPDGRVGTSDDEGPLQVWQCLNPGETYNDFINPQKGNPGWLTEDPKWYSRGIMIIFTKKFSNRWQMIASYHYTNSKGNTQGATWDWANPNSFINSYGEQDYYNRQPHQFKIQGNVILPLDISLGIYAQATSGRNNPPSFYAYGIPGISYALIYTKPYGEIKTDPQTNVNLRLEKIFKIMGGKVTFLVNIFNVFNNYTGNNVSRSYGRYYGLRSGIKIPRTFRIGFRIIY